MASATPSSSSESKDPQSENATQSIEITTVPNGGLHAGQLEPKTRSSTDSRSSLERQPWKYDGIPAFSKWAASDEDCFTIRRFGVMNTRVILQMQADIGAIEKKIEELDATASKPETGAVNNGSFAWDPIAERRELLTKMHAKLKEYSSLTSLTPPSNSTCS